MLLPPGEDTTLSIASSHEPFDFLAIQTFGPRAIPKSAALFEINSVLVKQVETLLFIVCVGRGGESGKFAENERGKYGQDVSWAQCKSVLQAMRVCGGRGESNPSAPCTRRPPPERKSELTPDRNRSDGYVRPDQIGNSANEKRKISCRRRPGT